jgi:hypothetical protein
MRVLAGIVLSLALLTGLTACGGDDNDKKSDDQVATEFGNLKPEDVRASAAEVADGFDELKNYADEVVAKLGVDDAAAAETQERLLTIWESILGTVKANDPAAYQKLDTALNVLMTAKGADGKAQAEGAAATVHSTAEDYVKRYPNDGSAEPESTEPPVDSGTDDSGDSGGGLTY